jgi:ABC-2 type transport system permease protein
MIMADDMGSSGAAAIAAAPARSAAPSGFNAHGVWAIYRFQMARFFRTLGESVATPVITSALYFVVFGVALGDKMPAVNNVAFGSFIVPGIIMMSVFTNSIFNASFGIYFPKFIGTIYELLSAPVSEFEIVVGYVGSAATKSVILGLITLATAWAFGLHRIDHPVEMFVLLVLVSVSFSLFGFIIGIWAQSFEQLNFIPMLVITPLTFLGGSFYAIKDLPGIWGVIALFNPVAYLISGFRWAFFSVGDVAIGWSVFAMLVFLGLCMAVVTWMFKTGYRLKN